MKLVVSDLDGTLLTDDKKVNEYTINTLRELHKRGINFAIATGRGYFSTKYIKDLIGIPMFMICNNGANIYDLEENLIHRAFIPKDIVQKVVKLLRNYKVDYRAFHGIDYNYPSYGVIDEKRLEYAGIIEDDIEKYTDSEKIIMLEENRELYKKVKDEAIKLFSDKLEIVSSSEICLDFNIKNCSKKEALLKIMEHYNLDKNEVIAFGDSENDYEMLKFVGQGIAMKDSYMSTKDLKNETDFTNNFDGVAKYIEKTLF